MFTYAVFVDDHEHGSMRLHATYLDEYAALNCAKALSPNGDGLIVTRFTMVNAVDVTDTESEEG